MDSHGSCLENSVSVTMCLAMVCRVDVQGWFGFCEVHMLRLRVVGPNVRGVRALPSYPA